MKIAVIPKQYKTLRLLKPQRIQSAIRDASIILLKPTGHVMHHQFNIQQL
jgi:hypothetical protein